MERSTKRAADATRQRGVALTAFMVDAMLGAREGRHVYTDVYVCS